MRIDNVADPKSSFLSMEKDLSLITNKILGNQRLKKLLFYTTPDALNQPELTQEQSAELFGNNIRMVPKLFVDSDLINYLVIRFKNFQPNYSNPEFRNNVLEFDIVCPYDQWHLKDFQLRPYRIAAELDAMLDKEHLTGIGRLEFLGAEQIILSDNFAGLCLQYLAIHGEEDKKGFVNPQDEEQFLADFLK